MSDTQRSASEVLALHPDNTAGEISPQDIRDGWKSVAFRDGSQGFTAVVEGVTPTADAHLATKGYADSWPKFGSINHSATATTALTQMVWSEIAGTFALGTIGSIGWTLAPSGAGLVWGGTESVWVDVTGQAAFSNAGNGNSLALGVAVDGVIQGDHGHVVSTSLGDTMATVTQVVLVAPGETVSLQIQNHTSSDDADVPHLTCTMRAYPVQS